MEQSLCLAPVIQWSHALELTEQDCACPAPSGAFLMNRLLQTSTAKDSSRGETLVSQRWQQAPQLYRTILSDQNELVFNPANPVAVAVLNTVATQILNAFAAPARLDQVTVPLPHLNAAELAKSVELFAALQLLEPKDPVAVSGRSSPSPNSHTTLTAWLHVTNACNLRCTYCYIQKTNELMDEETGKAAIDAIVRSALIHGFKQIKLKYAGGEATLNFPLIKRLHTYAQACADANDLSLQAVLLSNGVALTPSMLEFIRTQHIRLSISLDGIGATHDRQRIFTEGTGSFKQVMRGIQRAAEYGVQPYLSITVTAQNANALAEVVDFALTHDLLFNLNFYRQHTTSAPTEQLQAEDERLSAGVKRAFAVIERRLPAYPLIGALLDRANFATPHTYACGAGHSYLVIDQRGNVARCQMEIERPVTTVLHDDPLTEIRLYTDGFQNIGVEEKEGCRQCEWRHWCAGGCPLLTYRIMGRNDVKSPYCNVYKALYPELLRLEGLRLLKWGENHL